MSAAQARTSEKLTFARIAPHVYLQSYPARVSDEELAAFFVQLEKEIERMERPFTWVANFAWLQATDAKQRRIASEFEKRTAAIDLYHCAGTAFVMPNLWLRGLATAVFWVARPVYPYSFVDNLEDAVTWCTAALAARGTHACLPTDEILVRLKMQLQDASLSADFVSRG